MYLRYEAVMQRMTMAVKYSKYLQVDCKYMENPARLVALLPHSYDIA